MQAVAPQAAGRVDWPSLEAAPAWLALNDDELARLALRIGAMQRAPVLRMWIDAPRLAAAGAAVGDDFLQALLALPEAQVLLPPDLVDGPAIGTPGQVVPVLRAAGRGVLLAALPDDKLRDAVAACWSPDRPCAMAEAMARMLVARVEWLVVRIRTAGEAQRLPPPAAPAPELSSGESR